jgi:hypothetical protein
MPDLPGLQGNLPFRGLPPLYSLKSNRFLGQHIQLLLPFLLTGSKKGQPCCTVQFLQETDHDWAYWSIDGYKYPGMYGIVSTHICYHVHLDRHKYSCRTVPVESKEKLVLWRA